MTKPLARTGGRLPAASRARGSLFPLFLTFFLISGAAGLVYEVLWMRQFGLVMGNTSLSLSAVLAAFMGGLALGSWRGGRIADRPRAGARSLLMLYGKLELAIGLYALAIPSLIAAGRPLLAQLYQSDPSGWPVHAARFVLAISIMIVPATLMGATLPILIRSFTGRLEDVGRRVGTLYGVNTLGAMIGAFVAGFFLIPLLGMRATGWTAASANILLGLMTMHLARRLPEANSTGETAEGTSSIPEEEVVESRSSASILISLATALFSGVAAMIYQVCWTRIFALMIGSSTYGFTIVLVATIGGLALGALVFGALVERTRPRLALLSGIQIFIAVSNFALASFSSELPGLVIRISRSHEGGYAGLLAREFLLAGLLLLPSTFLMGGVFPVIAHICAGSTRGLGRSIGTVYAVNTVGAVAGSLAASLILMRFLGVGPALLVAMGLNLAMAAFLALSEHRWRLIERLALAMAVLVVAATLIVMPPQWERGLLASAPFAQEARPGSSAMDADEFLDAAGANQLLYYRDGISGTVAVHRTPPPLAQTWLSVNGKPDASDGPTDMQTQLLAGHLGMALRPESRRVMVLGLGCGVTLGAVLSHPTVERVDLVEISPEVVEAVRLHYGDLNHHALDDPRTRVILADGRNHLELTGEKYDLIVSEPSNPWMAGIATMFTREFAALARSHLNPGGLLLQWVQLYNISREDIGLVYRTFAHEMPHVTLWEAKDSDLLLVGSDQPLRLEWDKFTEAIAIPTVRADLARAGLTDPRVFVTQFVATMPHLIEQGIVGPGRLNLDDSCELEFSAPKAFYDRSRRIPITEAYAWRESPRKIFVPEKTPADVAEWMDRVAPSRLQTKKAVDIAPPPDLGSIGPQFRKAIKLNPYDYVPRNYYLSLCLGCAQRESLLDRIPQARAWAEEGIKTYLELPIVYDRWVLANLYHMAGTTAERMGDTESAERQRKAIFDLGGQALVDKFAAQPAPAS